MNEEAIGTLATDEALKALLADALATGDPEVIAQAVIAAYRSPPIVARRVRDGEPQERDGAFDDDSGEHPFMSTKSNLSVKRWQDVKKLRRFTVTQLRLHFNVVVEAARDGPVAITVSGRVRFVVMTKSDYARMVKGSGRKPSP
jgi:prevent-host-death family protein